MPPRAAAKNKAAPYGWAAPGTPAVHMNAGEIGGGGAEQLAPRAVQLSSQNCKSPLFLTLSRVGGATLKPLYTCAAVLRLSYSGGSCGRDILAARTCEGSLNNWLVNRSKWNMR